MKKNAFIRSVSALLALWYVLATVGFDIHRSADSQRTYVIPLFADLSCESIHPDAPCRHHHGACCDHDAVGHHDSCYGEDCCNGCECGCDDDEDCCTDTFKRLSALCEQALSFEIPAPQVIVAAAPAFCPAASAYEVPCSGTLSTGPCAASPGPPPDILSSICMLRA